MTCKVVPGAGVEDQNDFGVTNVITDLHEADRQASLLKTSNPFCSLQEAGHRFVTESSLLTFSSQLQPRSSIPAGAGADAAGLETSSGMVGLWGGVLSKWFRLPWVPLLGAGFRPRRSEGGKWK